MKAILGMYFQKNDGEEIDKEQFKYITQKHYISTWRRR